ncbi:hypothetical protein BHE74_00021904 [Ensete ventricosum]|nr:hypothetical protein BHE74_00021904 [Ensete ventricosum]
MWQALVRYYLYWRIGGRQLCRRSPPLRAGELLAGVTSASTLWADDCVDDILAHKQFWPRASGSFAAFTCEPTLCNRPSTHVLHSNGDRHRRCSLDRCEIYLSTHTIRLSGHRGGEKAEENRRGNHKKF